MLSEIFVLIFVVILCIQSSSLTSSLIIVPSSILLVVMTNLNLFLSGFTCFIFIMIFIGGLMVLLVSVASSVNQEEGTFPKKNYIFFLFMVFIFLNEDFQGFSDFMESNNVSIISVLMQKKNGVILSIFLILFLCLFVITKMVLDYKGMVRNL